MLLRSEVGCAKLLSLLVSQRHLGKRMSNRFKALLPVAAATLCMAGEAKGGLVDRGGGMIYDTDISDPAGRARTPSRRNLSRG